MLLKLCRLRNVLDVAMDIPLCYVQRMLKTNAISRPCQFGHTSIRHLRTIVDNSVAFRKTWEPIDESLKQSGVIQKTAEKISQYLSGLSPEVVKVSSRRIKKDMNTEDIPAQT